MGCVKSDRFIVKLMDQFLPGYHHIKWKLKKKKKKIIFVPMLIIWQILNHSPNLEF